MTAQDLVVLIGHPKPRSRTRAIVLRFAEVLVDELHRNGVVPAGTQVVDLVDIAPHLLTPGTPHAADAVRNAIAAVTDARLLVAGSPTFKGTYSGLLKVFLDLLPRAGLPGTVAIPVMTAASPLHSHAVDTYLRPLLTTLHACVPVPGVTVLESEFAFSDSVLTAWASASVPTVAGVLRTDRHGLGLIQRAGAL